MLRATALIGGLGNLGLVVGVVGGCLLNQKEFSRDPYSSKNPFRLTSVGMLLGGISGVVGGFQIEKGILRNNKSIKIQLSGNGAWKVNHIVIPLN